MTRRVLILASALGLAACFEIGPPSSRPPRVHSLRATPDLGDGIGGVEGVRAWFSKNGTAPPTAVAAAREWSQISHVIALTSSSDATALDGAALGAAMEESAPTLDALLSACAEKAPALVASARDVLPLARLAAWVPRARWARPLEEWSPAPADAADAGAALRSLEQHTLETWPVPEALHGSLAHADSGGGVFACTEAAHRVARGFTLVHAAAGLGEASVRDELRRQVTSAITKTMAKEFVEPPPPPSAEPGAEPGAQGSPLHALRRAQARALGGDAWVGDAHHTSCRG